MQSDLIQEAVMLARPDATFPFGVTGEEVKRRFTGADPIVKPLISEAIRAADEALQSPMPGLSWSLFRLFEESGDRERYQRVYFARRGRLMALAAALAADGGGNYAEALQDAIWEICNEYTWCLPAHLPDRHLPPERTVDLFAAETAHALAEIVRLTGDRLDGAVVRRVHDETERRVFEPILTRPERFPWETAQHNWAAVCGGAAGMAALILTDDRARLAAIIERAVRAMESFLAGYGDDGGCAEGIGYWEYGVGYFVYFAEMLRAFTAGRLDLMDSAKARAIAAFPAAVHLSEGVFANYSDSPERKRLASGLLSRLAVRTGERAAFPCSVPGFHEDPCYRWGPFSRNLLWTDPAWFGAASRDGAVFLADRVWLVDRRKLMPPASPAPLAAAFSAKGGHNDEPHNHNDLGHFILHGGGENLLIDLGHGLYTKDYFGAGRYRILNNASAGHSVPIIGGMEQAAGREHRAELLYWAERENGSELGLDLTRAYPREAGLTRFVRTFRWEADGEEGRLTLEDEFHFLETGAAGEERAAAGSAGSADSEGHAVEERFISAVRPELKDGFAVWRGRSARLELRYDGGLFSGESLAAEIMTHEDEPMTVYILRLKSRAAGRALKVCFDFRLTARDAVRSGD